MKFTDLLTIAMPVYERKEFFVNALESALNQTVKCKVIVIDNCSSHDYFEKVCKEKNVTYYRNERNIGITGNFSKGFEISKSKYTINLQDDDQLSPIYVESFLNALKLHSDIDIFFSNFLIQTSNGELSHQHTLPFGYMSNGNKIIEYGIKYKLGFPYMTSSIKNNIAHSYLEVKDSVGSFDWEWIYSKADKLSFYGDSRKLYRYRQHGNQDTKRNSIFFMLTIPFIYERILKDKVSDIKLKRKALRNAFWILVLLRANANKKELKRIRNGNTKYDEYLNSKLKNNSLLKAIFIFPRGFVSFVLRSLRKLGISGI